MTPTDGLPTGLTQGPCMSPDMEEAFDRAVAQSDDVDRFCSASAWVLPAHQAFHARHAATVTPIGDGFLALAQGDAEHLGPYLAALEAMWGLACPLVGPAPLELGREAGRVLLARKDWHILWLGGLERDSARFQGLVTSLGRHCELRLGPTTQRYQAALEGGYDGWLGRRSPRFRKTLRQLSRRGPDLTFEWIDGRHSLSVTEAEALYERIHAVETRSWKGLEGTGFVAGDMRLFYALMVPRLARRRDDRGHNLRVLFARDGDRDVAVCFGGVFGDTFRGLQNSFDDRFREYALGNRMQSEVIARLAEEGLAIYDLGSEMDYKARWAETQRATVTLIAVRRS